MKKEQLLVLLCVLGLVAIVAIACCHTKSTPALDCYNQCADAGLSRAANPLDGGACICVNRNAPLGRLTPRYRADAGAL